MLDNYLFRCVLIFGIIVGQGRAVLAVGTCTCKGWGLFWIFSSPGRSPGRAIVLPPASASALASASAFGVGGGGVSKKFNVKVFYVMGKALSGELSCPCDRSCLLTYRLFCLAFLSPCL